MLCRFALVYICICLCSRPPRWRTESWHDEGLCLLSGLTGASLYFITENTALEYTLVTNVALIVCTCPLLTLPGQCLVEEKRLPGRWLCLGTLLALAGVAVVILRGQFVLQLNPVGDLLCLGTALSWTAYTFVNRKLLRRYPSMFVVRKTFFYGLLTLAPIIGLQGNAFRAGRDVLLRVGLMSPFAFCERSFCHVTLKPSRLYINRLGFLFGRGLGYLTDLFLSCRLSGWRSGKVERMRADLHKALP